MENKWTILLVAGLMTIVGLQPANANQKLVKTTIAYRTVGDHQILLDVHRPDDQTTCPVIVWIHGGALIMGHRESVASPILELAQNRGAAVVSLDYRLAPETKLPAIISDIESAFRWLDKTGREQFQLDANRIVVVGGSAGGYLTLITGYRVKPQPKALVALYGYGNLVADWYSKPSPHPRHNPRAISKAEADRQTDGSVISDARQRKGNGGSIYLHYRQQGIWPEEVSGFPVDQLRKHIAPFEPVKNVSPSFPTTMLIHGTKDTDVPFEESTEMAAQFKKHGVPYVLKTIENGEHGFGGGDPAEIKAAYQGMREFIAKHLDVAEKR